MVDITTGYAFGPTEEVTATKLHNSVDLAAFANLALADFASGEKPIFKGGAAPPTPIAGQLWLNAAPIGTANPFWYLAAYTGTEWTLVCEGTRLHAAVDYSFGDPVFASLTADETIDNPAPLHRTRILGIVAEDIAAGSSGLIITHGFARTYAVGTNQQFISAANGSGGGYAGFLSSSYAASQGVFGRILAINQPANFQSLCWITGLMKVTL